MASKNKFLILIFLICLAGAPVGAADVIKDGDELNVRQCVEIALKHHPAVNAATGRIMQSEARIGQARSEYLPKLHLQSGYTRSRPASQSLTGSSDNRYSNTLTLQQTLFDFGKTSAAVDIQKMGKQTAETDFQDTASSVILGVRQAYYSLLKASMSRRVAEETVDQFARHLEVAGIFFETGKASKIDVTSAEVNLSNARLQLISAQNAQLIARAGLNNAMGLSAAPQYSLSEEFHPEAPDISFDEALGLALENRADIKAAILRIEALKRNVDLQKKGYLPVVSGNADYGYSGNDTDMYQSWSAGIFLSFPVFTGLSTKYAVAEARADLSVAQANEEELRQYIRMEVENAWLSGKEAFERVEAGKIIVRQAEEALELADGRYKTGVGNSIELTDAVLKLNSAKLVYINALSDFEISRARLEKAMGEIK
jgi:TolC family type I secretion outer membrane protein